MSCDCLYACPIDQCTTTLYIGVVASGSDAYVVFEDLTTGRIRRVFITSEEDGDVFVTPPAGFLSSSFKYKIYLVSGNSLCDKIDFTVDEIQVPCVQFDVVNIGNISEQVVSAIELQQQPIPILDEDGNNIFDEDYNPILSS